MRNKEVEQQKNLPEKKPLNFAWNVNRALWDKKKNFFVYVPL